jgi:flagellar hook-associated protein 3 FlgL
VRVTDGSLFDTALRGIQRAQRRAAAAQEVVSSGLRVSRPADDPTAAALARRAKTRLARAESSLRTADAGFSFAAEAESALGKVGELLARARELAVELGNDTYDATDRAAAAFEVDELRRAALALANTEIGGVYVFAGFRTGTPPFTPAGAYVGDDGTRELEVAPGVRVQAGFPGRDAFAPGAGVDVFATLDALAGALRANDAAAVRASLGPLGRGTEQILEARARAGAQMDAFETARGAAMRVRDSALAERARLVEADPFESVSELVKAQRAVEAAVAVMSGLGTRTGVAST